MSQNDKSEYESICKEKPTSSGHLYYLLPLIIGFGLFVIGASNMNIRMNIGIVVMFMVIMFLVSIGTYKIVVSSCDGVYSVYSNIVTYSCCLMFMGFMFVCGTFNLKSNNVIV